MPSFRDPFGYRALAGQIAAFRNSMEKHMSALSDQQDIVDAAVAKLGTDMTKSLADLTAAIAAAGGSSADVTAEITRLQATAATLAGFDTQAVAADPSTVAPPPPVTPAPAA